MSKKISVPDMHCEKCVKRIAEALNKAKIEAEVNLQAKSVDIKNDADLKNALNEIYELGFSPEEAK